jgi:hypothetical protein
MPTVEEIAEKLKLTKDQRARLDQLKNENPEEKRTSKTPEKTTFGLYVHKGDTIETIDARLAKIREKAIAFLNESPDYFRARAILNLPHENNALDRNVTMKVRKK